MVQLAMAGSYSSFDFKILLPKILLAENSTELTQPYSYKTLKKGGIFQPDIQIPSNQKF